MNPGRIALICTGAAVSAAVVLGGAAVVVLPFLCENGFGPDRCNPDKQIAAVEAPLAFVDEEPVERAPIVVLESGGVPKAAFEEVETTLQTRSVKVVPVQPRGSGMAPIVGAMMVPYSVEPGSPGIHDVGADEDELPTVRTAIVADTVPPEPTVPMEVAAATPLDETGEEAARRAEVAEANSAASEQEAGTAAEDQADMREVSQGANVRSGPSRGEAVLFALNAGEEIEVAAEDGGWLHIEDDQGRKGWIYSDFVR